MIHTIKPAIQPPTATTTPTASKSSLSLFFSHEIDREARKGKPLPSDHAPLVIDIDSPGYPFDAGWASADSRIAVRQRNQDGGPEVANCGGSGYRTC